MNLTPFLCQEIAASVSFCMQTDNLHTLTMLWSGGNACQNLHTHTMRHFFQFPRRLLLCRNSHIRTSDVIHLKCASCQHSPSESYYGSTNELDLNESLSRPAFTFRFSPERCHCVSPGLGVDRTIVRLLKGVVSNNTWCLLAVPLLLVYSGVPLWF